MKKVWQGEVWAGGELIGDASCSYDSSDFRRPASTHLFCCRCGDVWAKVLFPLAKHHAVNYVPCRKHGGGVLNNEYQGRFECDFSAGVDLWDFMTLSDGRFWKAEDSHCGGIFESVRVGQNLF